ncbi:MAG TPA: MFS transporter [Candidatus Sulfotelmatobacter sp.]|nr:MFS transporter [Candidatus Sulfotelmatobacter sp.]HKT89408.1 MFS transporter [Candidatus Sulfotelmatobacter sp.]
MPSLKLYPKTALALLTALNLFNYIDRSVLFAVQELIKQEFHRSDATFGMLTSVFFIFYMCAAPFMGPLSVRFSRKKVIVAGGLIWSFATLLTAVTHNFTELLVRHTLVGIGEASFVILSPTFVADMFPERQRGRVMGIFYLAIPVGTALGYILGGFMGPAYGWRAPFYVGAAPGVVLSLLLLLIPEPPLGLYDPHEKTPDRDTLKGLAHNPAFLTATLGMAMMTFALGGLQVWMPTFLHRARGYTLGQANDLFGLSIAVNGLVASLAGGWLSDYILRRTRTAHYLVSAVSLALGIPAMWLALYTVGTQMIVGIFLAEFLLLLNTGPLNAAVINSVSAPIRAMALAANIFIFHLLGDVPSAYLIGYLSDHYSLQLAFLGPVVAIGLSSAILFYGMKFAPVVTDANIAIEARKT